VHLIVKSELADENGIKYGLGSSAAVVVSVVEAILTRFMSKVPQRSLVFKLAAIAHVKTQGSGSGADIAASVYGGLLRYASYQSNLCLNRILYNFLSHGLGLRHQQRNSLVECCR